MAPQGLSYLISIGYLTHHPRTRVGIPTVQMRKPRLRGVSWPMPLTGKRLYLKNLLNWGKMPQGPWEEVEMGGRKGKRKRAENTGISIG